MYWATWQSPLLPELTPPARSHHPQKPNPFPVPGKVPVPANVSCQFALLYALAGVAPTAAIPAVISAPVAQTASAAVLIRLSIPSPPRDQPCDRAPAAVASPGTRSSATLLDASRSCLCLVRHQRERQITTPMAHYSHCYPISHYYPFYSDYPSYPATHCGPPVVARRGAFGPGPRDVRARGVG